MNPRTRSVLLMKLGKPFFTFNEYKKIEETNGKPADVEWNDDNTGVAYYVEVLYR